ncbi:MAG: PepSY domain-containing protein [Anaerolineaceae bacterium]|nr:PepSY domain-containing protein [Anaerolineaceae bacterium]
MKINKFFALAVVAVMAIGVMGFYSTRAHAQSGTTPAPQVQVTEADTDNVEENVEEQVGDQNVQDTVVTDIETDTDNIDEQVGEQVEDGLPDGNEAVETKSSDGQDAVPTGTPSISSNSALQAAQAYLNTTASGTATLDDENGILVYSVDLNGSDVKVDAMTGIVLGVDQVGDGQFEGDN